ncbi:MAG: class I SAM-dependent methyltransferase family protein [Thermoplasmata archaeon]|nr:class I SAM-dependent methyltransferase family protein [Thermoplasmata archaeon]
MNCMKDGSRFAVVVRKEEAEEVKKKLLELKALDEGRRIIRHGNFVEFPVKWAVDGYKIVEQKRIVKRKIFPPFEEIKRRLYGKICRDDFQKLPCKWEKFGDVLVLKMEGIKEKEKIAEVYASALKCKSVLEDIGGIEGIERKPNFKFIFGNDSETIHVENRIKYKFDVARIMFSSGNIDERIRMARVVKKNDIVIDMFAGIGYFTLPMAYHGKAKVYAIELNPLAFKYLKENIKLNKLEERVFPILGDCREKIPHGVANRIVMGYLNSIPFFKYALKGLKGKGIIHFHQKCREEEFPHAVFNEVKEIALQEGYEAEAIFHKKIKSYAPHIIHGVIDIKVKKMNKKSRQ